MEARTLKGFRDYLPDVEAQRRAMIRTIEDVFERHGFLPLQTPALEYADTLLGKYGDEGDKLLYRFEDQGQRDVALRYDLTVPLARVVAQHRNDLQLPFRRYQIAPVWRADKPQRGRFREFVQCDADIAGVNSALTDAEVIVTGLAVLRALGIRDAVLHLNHRQVLFVLVHAAGIPDGDAPMAVIRAIDKLDKLPAGAVRAEIAELPDVGPDRATKVLELFSSVRTVADLAPLAQADEGALQRLGDVLRLVEAAGLGDMVAFTPTIARGLDYYTGVIYEVRLTDPRAAGIGSVMSGGRYDELVGQFSKEKVPAVGISLGLDRLLAALQELGLVATDAARVPAYVCAFVGHESEAMKIAQELRDAGVRCEVDAQGGKLGKQLERAAKRGARFAVLAGEAECAEGVAVLKDLAAGTQERVARAALAQTLRESSER
jgi:histidyl-tRNA synthetase